MKAMEESFTAIAASLMTTVFGFLALMLMEFKIGPDMGIVLAKGVVLSFLTVVTLLPILAIYTTKIMDKTKHRSFLPSFRPFSSFVIRVRIPLAVLLLLAIAPSVLAPRSNQFVYGSSSMNGEDSQIKKDTDFIRGDLRQRPADGASGAGGRPGRRGPTDGGTQKSSRLTSVTSYASAVGTEVPASS